MIIAERSLRAAICGLVFCIPFDRVTTRDVTCAAFDGIGGTGRAAAANALRRGLKLVLRGGGGGSGAVTLRRLASVASGGQAVEIFLLAGWDLTGGSGELVLAPIRLL